MMVRQSVLTSVLPLVLLAGCSCPSTVGRTQRDIVLHQLRVVAKSSNYYWAWTSPWLKDWDPKGDPRFVIPDGDGFRSKPTDEVELSCSYQQYAGGRRTVINYADLCAITGTWHEDRYYQINRAGLAAAVRRQWQEFGGLMVFSWHMDHPYCSFGYKKDSYRFKSEGENRNVIRQILDGTGGPCGTDTLGARARRTPCANPREWFFKSLKDVADFFNSLVDEKTGQKIPVVVRYPHECDGDWFWWGRTWCSADEYRRFCRQEADYLRNACGEGQILFAYTPDRTWREFGREGDSENTFLAYYAGDAYVDILGLDDYSIGNGDDVKVETNYRETLRKLRAMTKFAEARNKVVAIAESGGKTRRDDFWRYLHRLASAEGVSVAYVNTWSWIYGTTPQNERSKQEEIAFAARPQVLMEGSGMGFRKVCNER